MKYRKKPVIIEAFRLAYDLVPDWFQYPIANIHGVLDVSIPTLEGTMIAMHGDYIIKGVKGEIYPCKSDIFEMTYEALGQE